MVRVSLTAAELDPVIRSIERDAAVAWSQPLVHRFREIAPMWRIPKVTERIVGRGVTLTAGATAAPRRVIEFAIEPDELARLEALARSRTEPASRVERARIVLAYRADPSSTAVGARIGVTHQTVQRWPSGGAWGDGGAR